MKKKSLNLEKLAVAVGGVYVEAAPKFLDETIRWFKKVGFNPMGETKFDFGTEVTFTKETPSGIYYNVFIKGNKVLEGVVANAPKDLRKLRDALINLGKSVEGLDSVDLGV